MTRPHRDENEIVCGAAPALIDHPDQVSKAQAAVNTREDRCEAMVFLMAIG
jgi:hypothetical protein